MNWETIIIPRTNESVYKGTHPTGLPMYVCPKPSYTSTYAVLATRYGSIDNTFEVDGKLLTVPAGIAHYLEHKLFENEDCDAFERYARTGASANAYTGFGQTAYLFSCTDNVKESLEILLSFVQDPYFTDQNVDKERGIIQQEIRMCEDRPGRLAMFQLLELLYHSHPVKIDIAGTVESIQDITPELLYDCYRAFYNLHNMVLVVSGNVTPEMVGEVADKTLKPAAPFTLKKCQPTEPDRVVATRKEAHMPVATPLFYIGIKQKVTPGYLHTGKELMATELLLELLAGHGSPLYTRLLNHGLINEGFGGGHFEGAGYGAILFSGESKDPDSVLEALREEIQKMLKDGIDEERFLEEKNAMYGRLLMGLDDVENCADWLIDDHFYGRTPYELIDSASTLDVQFVYDVLKTGFPLDNMALSVVSPACGKEE